jgi:circadian clock protein KaiC
VAKLRGSAFLDGDHVYDLSERGLTVYPRLVPPQQREGPPPRREDPAGGGAPAGDGAPASGEGPAASGAPTGEDLSAPATVERLESGIHGLDDMIEAGWLRGTATLVAGPAGAGKTMLGLHFLRQGSAVGEPGLLLGFQENPAQLRRQLVSLGWDPGSLLGPGGIDHLYHTPVEMHVDAILRQVFARLDQHDVRRVVVDALGDLERCATSHQRFHDYLYSFLQHLVSREVTVMLLMEKPTATMLQGGGGQLFHLHREVSNMSDNILQLDMELAGSLTRTVQVTKSRSSAHDLTRRVLRITDTGLAVE